MKRIFDMLLCLILLLLLSPLLLIVAFLIKSKMDSPVVFTQQRGGFLGNPFRIYKFRTMTDAKDAQGKILSDAERLTTLGKWLRKLSLDELPQLFNILKSDMSFVGPRPLFTQYLPLYSKEQARRHEVKPGITGWAQVNGRNAINWEEKFKLDVWYVEHQSFVLDLKIIWLTVLKIIHSEGINQEGHVTMEPFRGNRNS
ncbi:sugar transferase [Deltaproteobacteria bacterium TL4]